MTATLGSAAGAPSARLAQPDEPRGVQRLWRRELSHYPATPARMSSLAIVVLATIILYYEFYLSGAVATQIIGDLHMSFVYYVNISVVGYVLGAVASFMAGLADRYGRANIITVGLFITGLLTLVGIPNAHSKLSFGVLAVLIGFVEGIILVATPALVRDFSPQLGRASAMGFWTLGPVVGSLVVSEVVSHTFHPLQGDPWQDQYIICGVVGLVVALIAAVGLRELAPALRDQIMVSEKDKVLLEARARGVSAEELAAGMRKPFRQMLHLDITGSAFAISVFLIIYYTAVGFYPVYFETVHGFTANQANSLGNWLWAGNAISLLVVGVLSDLLRVRKPLMVVGAIGAIITTAIFAVSATHHLGGAASSSTVNSYIVMTLLISIFLGVAYAPWMASFTETVERRNPALIATGLAVWGIIIRAVIAIAVFIVPHIVTTVTTLVEKGPVVQQAARANAGVLAAVTAHPDVVAQVQAISKRDADVLPKVLANQGLVQQLGGYAATGQIPPAALLGQAAQVLGLPVLTRLADPQVQKDLVYLSTTAPTALGAANLAKLSDPKVQADLAYLQANAPGVQSAAARSPRQWRTYFWIGVGGEVVFLPLIFLMAGVWSPRKAKHLADEHEAAVNSELSAMAAGEPATAQPATDGSSAPRTRGPKHGAGR